MDQNKLKAVIFDLDGTLLDSLEDIADAMNAVLTQRGHPVHPVSAYRYFIGDGQAKLVKKTLPPENRTLNEMEEALGELKTFYRSHWNVKTKAYDGVQELLGALQARFVPMAVLSNKLHDFTVLMTGHYFPLAPFQSVQGSRPSVPMKPDPHSALETAKALGYKPEQILYLGDSAVDMQTAQAAKMFALGAAWGFRSERELLENGAMGIINHPMELLTYL